MRASAVALIIKISTHIRKLYIYVLHSAKIVDYSERECQVFVVPSRKIEYFCTGSEAPITLSHRPIALRKKKPQGEGSVSKIKNYREDIIFLQEEYQAGRLETQQKNIATSRYLRYNFIVLKKY